MSGPKTLSMLLGRMQHFGAFWRRHGVFGIPELAAGTYDRKVAGESMTRYLSCVPADERLDVLVCENDVLALGAIDAARSSFGLSVPSDLAFVGYDGIDLAAAPAYDLTTFEQPMAARVDRLVDILVGRAEPISVNVDGQLVVRGTT